MKKFSDMIQKSGEPDKNASSGVIKGRVAITKSDDDKMLAFGWANVSLTVDGETIEDYQGDIIEPEELENAAYNFVELYREGGEMHERGGAAVLIESVVFTEEKMKAIGIPHFLSVGGLASKSLMKMYGRKSKTANILCSQSREKQKG